MWSEACRHLERAETLHRRFYGVGTDSAGFSWEPPADVFETEREVLIEVALPGVSADALEVSVEAGVAMSSDWCGFPDIPGGRDPAHGAAPWPLRAAHPPGARTL
jgi:hypothetical protein